MCTGHACGPGNPYDEMPWRPLFRRSNFWTRFFSFVSPILDPALWFYDFLPLNWRIQFQAFSLGFDRNWSVVPQLRHFDLFGFFFSLFSSLFFFHIAHGFQNKKGGPASSFAVFLIDLSCKLQKHGRFSSFCSFRFASTVQTGLIPWDSFFW